MQHGSLARVSAARVRPNHRKSRYPFIRSLPTIFWSGENGASSRSQMTGFLPVTGPAAPRKTKALHGALGSTGLVTENFAEAGDAEEGPHNTWVVQSTAFMALFASVVGALFCDPPRVTTFEPP